MSLLFDTLTVSCVRLDGISLVDTLEKAALPVWTPKQREDLLHFIVVGGGPTGTFIPAIIRQDSWLYVGPYVHATRIVQLSL